MGWRRDWADLVNAYLAKIGLEQHVDRSSNPPTKPGRVTVAGKPSEDLASAR